MNFNGNQTKIVFVEKTLSCFCIKAEFLEGNARNSS